MVMGVKQFTRILECKLFILTRCQASVVFNSVSVNVNVNYYSFKTCLAERNTFFFFMFILKRNRLHQPGYCLVTNFRTLFCQLNR